MPSTVWSCIPRENKDGFVFYEGPPSANGLPGIHHVMARAIKDIFCRYKTQKGYQVKRKAGWDTHGLPVEIEVEKELGIKSKSEIPEFGTLKFFSSSTLVSNQFFLLKNSPHLLKAISLSTPVYFSKSPMNLVSFNESLSSYGFSFYLSSIQ